MKRKLIIIILLLKSLLFVQCDTFNNSNETKEQFAEYIFNCLKDNDYEKFTYNIMTKSDLEDLLQMSSLSDEEKKEELSKSNTTIKDMYSESKITFNTIRNEAIKAGIIWEDTKFVKIKEIKEDLKNSLLLAGFRFVLEYKSIQYEINIDGCIKSKRGWILSSQLEWIG